MRFLCLTDVAFHSNDSARQVYYVCHWISKGPKGERRLHAIALERTFLFMGQGQKRINIARVLALCGLGERLGKQNWERAKKLQRDGKATAWLREETDGGIDVSELNEIKASEENRRKLAEVRTSSSLSPVLRADLSSPQCEGILGGKNWRAFSDAPAAKL